MTCGPPTKRGQVGITTTNLVENCGGVGRGGGSSDKEKDASISAAMLKELTTSFPDDRPFHSNKNTAVGITQTHSCGTASGEHNKPVPKDDNASGRDGAMSPQEGVTKTGTHNIDVRHTKNNGRRMVRH